MVEVRESILFIAFRYALGRMTYVVGEVVESLITNWSNLTYEHQYLIQEEIKKSIQDKNAGMKMDVEQWSKILELQLKK